MTPLRTPRLILRDWREGDRDLFFTINSDEAVMEFFPFRRDRMQADQLMDWLRQDIAENGFGFAAVEIAETGETAGFCGLHRCRLEVFAPLEPVEIGWRLHRPFWGRGIASEAAREWLRFGFEEAGLDEIVSFAVRDNRRSLAVMERIGMRRDPARDFDHPGVPATHPRLVPHAFCALRADEWRRSQGK